MCKKPLCNSVSLDCDFAFPPEIFEDLSCFWTFLVNVIPEEIDEMMTFGESIAKYIYLHVDGSSESQYTRQ